MTLSELVAKINQFKPSEYDKDDITGWVNAVEFMAVDQVINRSEHRLPMPPKDPVVVNPGINNYVPEITPQRIPDLEFKPYVYAEDAERELLIPDQFKDAYIYFVSAKIDFQNMEIDRYNVNSQAFENEFQQYANWYRRTHKPKEVRHETTVYRHPDEPYPESY